MGSINLFSKADDGQATGKSRYQAVFDDLERHFADFESGAITINQYLAVVAEEIGRLQHQRPLWRVLGDRAAVLSVLGRAERAAWHEAMAALAWCQNWALELRTAQVSASMRQADGVVIDGAALPLDLAA